MSCWVPSAVKSGGLLRPFCFARICPNAFPFICPVARYWASSLDWMEQICMSLHVGSAIRKAGECSSAIDAGLHVLSTFAKGLDAKLLA